MVDFGISLAASPLMAEALRQLPWRDAPYPNFNPFNSASHCDLPVAISIVTKTEGEGRAKGHVQLNVCLHVDGQITIMEKFRSTRSY